MFFRLGANELTVLEYGSCILFRTSDRMHSGNIFVQVWPERLPFSVRLVIVENVVIYGRLFHTVVFWCFCPSFFLLLLIRQVVSYTFFVLDILRKIYMGGCSVLCSFVCIICI